MTEHYLNWRGSEFEYENLLYLDTIGNGDCLFHAIVQGFYTPYIEGYSSEREHPIDRVKLIDELKRNFSTHLADKRPDGKTWYEYLSRGQLPELSKEFPMLKLENLQKLLLTRFPLDNIFNEYISDVLDIDIYILDGDNRRVYVTGEEDLYLKGRKSVVILYQRGHYSTVGIYRNDRIQTFFDKNDEFILTIREKLKIN
jgi:hypothetical protein